MKYTNWGKCKSCKYLTTTNVKLVGEKLMDGHCDSLDMDIVVLGNTGCSEYKPRNE